MMQKPGVIDEVVFIIFPRVQRENQKQRYGKLSAEQLRTNLTKYLGIINKHHFMQLRDGQLSFDQVRARLDATWHDTHYQVLDDFKDQLPEEIYNAAYNKQWQTYFNKIYETKKHKDHNVPLEEILKEKEPYQTNPHCQRSLFKNVKSRVSLAPKVVKLDQPTQVKMVAGVPLDSENVKLQGKLKFVADKVARKLSKKEREYVMNMGLSAQDELCEKRVTRLILKMLNEHLDITDLDLRIEHIFNEIRKTIGNTYFPSEKPTTNKLASSVTSSQSDMDPDSKFLDRLRTEDNSKVILSKTRERQLEMQTTQKRIRFLKILGLIANKMDMRDVIHKAGPCKAQEEMDEAERLMSAVLNEKQPESPPPIEKEQKSPTSLVSVPEFIPPEFNPPKQVMSPFKIHSVKLMREVSDQDDTQPLPQEEVLSAGTARTRDKRKTRNGSSMTIDHIVQSPESPPENKVRPRFESKGKTERVRDSSPGTKTTMRMHQRESENAVTSRSGFTTRLDQVKVFKDEQDKLEITDELLDKVEAALVKTLQLEEPFSIIDDMSQEDLLLFNRFAIAHGLKDFKEMIKLHRQHINQMTTFSTQNIDRVNDYSPLPRKASAETMDSFLNLNTSYNSENKFAYQESYMAFLKSNLSQGLLIE